MLRNLKALISYGARFDSTVAKAPFFIIRQSNNDQLIAHMMYSVNIAGEILKFPKIQKKQLYSTDLSYLKKASKTSLAERLFESALHTQRLGERTRARFQEGKPAELSTTWSTTETEKIVPPDVTTITERLIEERLERNRAREMTIRKGTPYINKEIQVLTFFLKSSQTFRCRRYH